MNGRARKSEGGRRGCDGGLEHRRECLGDVKNVHGENLGSAVVEPVKDGVAWDDEQVPLRPKRGTKRGTQHSRAIAFRYQSSAPYMPAGLAMVASGNASRTARSLSYFDW